MNTQRNTMSFAVYAFVVSALLMLAALLASPAAAQETFSRTLTEAEINDAYRVANPRRAALSNVNVDLQPGQVVITADHATRNRGTVTTITTMQPSVDSGRVYWNVVSIVTADGQQASEDLIAQVNAAIATSWRNYFLGKVDGVVDSIAITDTEITLTGTFDGSRADEFEDRVEEGVESGAVNEEDTPGLFRWFQRRNP